MADPSKMAPSSQSGGQPRPSLDEWAPFFVTEDELEAFVKKKFPPTPEGRAALRAELEQADKALSERFAAAGWKLED